MRSIHTDSFIRRSRALVALLAVLAVGCRDSAPDDIIVQEETTEAIVFGCK